MACFTLNFKFSKACVCSKEGKLLWQWRPRKACLGVQTLGRMWREVPPKAGVEQGGVTITKEFRKTDMVAYSCYPSNGEVEARGSAAQHHFWLHNELRPAALATWILYKREFGACFQPGWHVSLATVIAHGITRCSPQ